MPRYSFHQLIACYENWHSAVLYAVFFRLEGGHLMQTLHWHDWISPNHMREDNLKFKKIWRPKICWLWWSWWGFLHGISYHTCKASVDILKTVFLPLCILYNIKENWTSLPLKLFARGFAKVVSTVYYTCYVLFLGAAVCYAQWGN